MLIKTTIFVDEEDRAAIFQITRNEKNTKMRGALTNAIREALKDWIAKKRGSKNDGG